MGCRIYDRELKCGCMISSDAGGGLMPCHYGFGCGKKGCNEHNQCKDCIKQEELCDKSWREWKKTDDYKKHMKEVQDKNE